MVDVKRTDKVAPKKEKTKVKKGCGIFAWILNVILILIFLISLLGIIFTVAKVNVGAFGTYLGYALAYIYVPGAIIIKQIGVDVMSVVVYGISVLAIICSVVQITRERQAKRADKDFNTKFGRGVFGTALFFGLMVILLRLFLYPLISTLL